MPAYSVLSGLDALQHADREITFNIQNQRVHRDAHPSTTGRFGCGGGRGTCKGDVDPEADLCRGELDALTGMRAFGHEDFGGEAGDRNVWSECHSTQRVRLFLVGSLWSVRFACKSCSDFWHAGKQWIDALRR